MKRLLRKALQVFVAAQLLAVPALAGGRAGDFDFYLLALSWSPTFCADEDVDHLSQCAAAADHAFVVHGLWPQYEDGYPEYCDTDYPQRLPLALIETVLDIMPGVGLVGGQWRKHGACTGLSPADYLALVRAARERVTVPEGIGTGGRERTLSADAVEAAFVAENPGLTRTGLALSCRDGRLAEVRICLDRELRFRDCRQVDRRGCRAARLDVPEAE